jgi:hypothetical protein
MLCQADLATGSTQMAPLSLSSIIPVQGPRFIIDTQTFIVTFNVQQPVGRRRNLDLLPMLFFPSTGSIVSVVVDPLTSLADRSAEG